MVLGALEGDGGWHFCSWYSAAVGTIWPIFSSLQLFLHSKMYRDEFRDLRALLDYWKTKKKSWKCVKSMQNYNFRYTVNSHYNFLSTPLFCPDQLDQRQIKCILTGQLKNCLFIVQGLFSVFQKVRIFFLKMLKCISLLSVCSICNRRVCTCILLVVLGVETILLSILIF